MSHDWNRPIPIYKTFDQTELNRQYNNREAVKDFPKYVQRWNEQSLHFRNEAIGHLDLSYGEHEREKLDIFIPKKLSPLARVVVFFHGGYWQAMDKSAFSFIAKPFTEQGFITVLPNYPLAPNVSMHELIESCRKSIAWLFHNIEQYGGNPRRLHISGHSAGGHITAMMLSSDWSQYSHDIKESIYSACSLSGLFELEPIRLTYLNNKLNLQSEDVKKLSPMYLNPGKSVPFLAAVGEEESEEYHDQSKELATQWHELGADTEYLSVTGTNHFSILDAFCDQKSALRQALIEMVNASY